MSLRPVCAICNVEMRCARNGVSVKTSLGTLVEGDRYQCDLCGAEIVTGFGKPYPSFATPDHDLTTRCPRCGSEGGGGCPECELAPQGEG